jgi:hypothetical protein
VALPFGSFLNSGSHFDARSSSESFPASTTDMIVAAASHLPAEAIKTTVSGV